MVDEKQIKQWLKDGTITSKQAQKMLVDSSKYKKEQRSNKFIVTISTIGSILVGIGAILFIASNWQVIPDILKVLILIGSTFAAYFIGYLFCYQNKNLPKVGASLMFLGALLFGATILLIAQIYNINANSHLLVLIWLIGVLPMVYAFASLPIAGLSSLLFFVWIGLLVFRNIDFGRAYGDFFALPVLYIAAGITLFAAGGLHYFYKKFSGVARIYRLAGIKVILLSLFLLTFRLFSGNYDGFNIRENATISGQFTVGLVIFSILAILLTVINWFFNKTEEISMIEHPTNLALTVFVLIFFFFPSATTNIYVLLFNIIFVGLLVLMLYAGYRREDMRLINLGVFWLSAFIIFKYFDFFWKLLHRSLFFIIGGLILVLGGIALEKKRRELKKKFKD